MTKTTKPAQSLAQLDKQFQTEDDCKRFLAEVRWPDGKVHCPRCGLSVKVYTLRTRPFHWKCKHCSKNGYRFSVLTGTVFENTNAPLRTWFRVAYLMTQSKKGMSALQIFRMIDPVRGSKGAYRTAWYMCHRIRAAMLDGDLLGKLAGEVEIDETFIGGKPKNRHRADRVRLAQKPGRYSGKATVIGAIARKGNVVAQLVEQLDTGTAAAFVRDTISERVSLVSSDEARVYQVVDAKGVRHETVNHSAGEYVRGNVHTANIDSFWSLLKRGIVGTFHQVSTDYLPLYVNEFSFRHNHRNDPDIFRKVIAGC